MEIGSQNKTRLEGSGFTRNLLQTEVQTVWVKDMQYLQNCYVLDLIYKSTSLKAVKGIYDKCIIY